MSESAKSVWRPLRFAFLICAFTVPFIAPSPCPSMMLLFISPMGLLYFLAMAIPALFARTSVY